MIDLRACTGTGLCLALLSPLTAGAQSQPSTDWTVATSNKASQRYAPLEQIAADNVHRLEEAWRWSSPDNALIESDEMFKSLRMQPGTFEASPLKIGNRLYVTTGYSQLSAIDARTGETVWTYDPQSYDSGRPPNLGFVHRGATYWQNEEGHGRVLYGTGNAYLRAVDAQTGEPVGDFGEGGAVDLTRGLRREFNRRGYSVSSPVVECNDTIVVGSSISDGQSHPEAPPGDVRGFDTETGKQLWTFQSIPQPGEFGHDTWKDESWRYTGNTNVWTLMSADDELGLVYLPFGTPTNDWYGGHRIGDNLFAESLVAVDCKTGERRWHFQTTHHGLWDYDLVTSAILGDVRVNGKEIQAAFQLTKQGFVFAFDRVTGEPIWPIEERPVAQSKVPGEVTSPTQPFPTRPPPYEVQGMSEERLVDFTPEIFEQARKILETYDYGPIYTPANSERTTLFLPGWAGGSSWQGGAFDPETGYLYVPSFTVLIGMQLQPPDPSRSSFDYVGGVQPIIEGPHGLPLVEPPWARLTAYDMNRGEIVWVETLGDGPRDHPALAGLDLPPLGTLARSHVLATRTLLFVTSGESLGRGYGPEPEDPKAFLRAFDKKSGDMLFEHQLPRSTDGSPITYMQDGTQYLVFALGGREAPAELIAFRLGDETESRRDTSGAP